VESEKFDLPLIGERYGGGKEKNPTCIRKERKRKKKIIKMRAIRSGENGH